MKIKSLVKFSGVPEGTYGVAVRDGNDMWKITWDADLVFRGVPMKKRPIEDWFNDFEFQKYLVKI